MAGVFKIKNVDDAEFTLTHPDGVGAVSIASNNIAKIDAVNAALALKANTDDLKELGVNQTWQDVTASRSVGVTYTNTTGKPIQLSLTLSGSSISLTISGIVAWTGSGAVGTALNYTSCIVPNGGTYVLSSGTISKWVELR